LATTFVAASQQRALDTPVVDGLIPRRSLSAPADVAGLPAIAGAVRLIASTIDQLPLTVTNGRVPTWLRRPRSFGSTLDLGDLIQHTVDGMVHRGYGSLRCVRVGESWRLDALNPDHVQALVSSGGVVNVSYLLDGQPIERVPGSPADAVQGRAYILPIPYIVTGRHPEGTSPIIEAAETLAGHVSTERHASRLFDTGATHTGGMLTTDGDITAATARRYRDMWTEARRDGHIPVIGGGLKYGNEVPDPGALQLLEARAFNQATAYMLLGIPPAYMGASLVGGQSSLSYQNAQDNKRLFRQSCLEAFTSQLSDGLSTLTGPGRNQDEETRIEFDYTQWEGGSGADNDQP
jgi:hypothetical protein